MVKIGNFLLGAVLGALLASLIAILLAPSSGAELQGQIKGTAHNIKDEVKRARETRRVELEQQLDKLRKPAA